MRPAGTVPQCGEEFGHIVERQRCMVLDLPHLAAGRQDMGEVAFPLRRIRPLPEAPHRRGVEHRLDAAPHPARGFGLLRPDRIEHLDNKPGIDRRHGQFPQSGVNVGGERRRPLRRVLRIAPARPVLFDELDSALAEGAALCDGNPLRLPLSRLCVERVNSLMPQLAVR